MSLAVYEIEPEGPVGNLAIATGEEYDRVVERLKKRSVGPWLVPETKIFSPFVPADIVGFGPNAVAFTSHATEQLRDLIDRYAEMLPIRSAYGEYAWFNCPEFLDCLDMERLEGTSASYGENIPLVWSDRGGPVRSDSFGGLISYSRLLSCCRLDGVTVGHWVRG